VGVTVRLVPLDGRYGIARLAPDAPLPAWGDGPGFVSLTRTADELSVVCRQERIPDGVRRDVDWRCLALAGPFAFGETGIVASVVGPISAGGLGVFVVSTFDGDHLLVKAADFAAACDLLAAAGHGIDRPAAGDGEGRA